ncbi:MAG: PEP-CTERM sorting domain-containing protein [Myxococcota bacterium]
MRWLLPLVFVWAAAAAAAQPASFTPLGDFPGGIVNSEARAVSADGSVVVGRGTTAVGREAFRWDATNGMQGLGTLPGGGASEADDVSDDGTIIVGFAFNAAGEKEAFAWDALNGMQGLGFLPGHDASGANGISPDGVYVLGNSRGASGPVAFRWSAAAGMEALDAPAGAASASSLHGSVVVGQADVHEPFRWDAVGGTQLLGSVPGNNRSWATAVTLDGSTVFGGGQATADGNAFRWDAASGLQNLGCLSPFPAICLSIVHDVSADGQRAVGGPLWAFVWEPLSGMRFLQDLLEDEGIDLSDWTLREAEGVSPDGTIIVGHGTNPNGDTEAFVAVLPEPGALLGFGAGASLLAGLARRRARG